jgi:retinol dehydrogenase-12
MRFHEFLYAQLITTPPVPTVSLFGQTIIITGGNRGLGFEAAKHMVRLGASKLILGVRSVSAGETAKTAILKANPSTSTDIEAWPIDLTSYYSVKGFAQRATETLPRIDSVINNAGLATAVYVTAEDNESTITVNIISTFLLSILMLPKLRESALTFGTTPCISVIGSEGMNFINFKERSVANGAILTTLNDKATANMQDRYFLTKLLVMYAVRELAAQIDNSTKNSGKRQRVILNCVAPGYCATDLAHEQKDTIKFKVMEKILARKPEVGSRCIVDGVVQGPKSHGQYLSESKVKP